MSRTASSPPDDSLGPPDDPALHPERNEEDQLLRPDSLPELAFHWDIPGRMRKLRDLVRRPQSLAAELIAVPDIFTPLFLLSLLGVAFILIHGEAAHALLRADALRVLATATAAQLTPMQREGLDNMIPTMQLWTIAAIGVIHIVIAGVYAVVLFWLARFLGFEPVGYPQWLSIAAFAWLPQPLFRLLLDWGLFLAKPYDSWSALRFDASNLYPGLHALLPADLPFDQYWAMAAFYLLGPIDIFLFLALAFIYAAIPYGMARPEPRLRLVVVFGIVLILGQAMQVRNELRPEMLRDLDQQTRQALDAGDLPPSP